MRVFKNETYVGRLSTLEKKRLVPARDVSVRFNDPDGQIALRAVDQTKTG